MCTESSAAVMADQLDNRQIFWRNLTRTQRRAVIRHIIAEMLDEHGEISRATYDDNRPHWAPQSQWLSRSTGLSLKQLSGERTTSVCECSRPALHSVPITVLTGSGEASPGTLDLCDACYADHMAMERIYG